MFGFFDVIQDILSNLRTFGLRDVIDIAVVSLAMYQILLFARKSRAGQLVRGLLLLLVFYALADVMQLRTVRWVLTNVMQIGFIAAIVLFQPELRRTLEHMGQSTNWTKLLFTTHRQDPTLRGAWQSAVVAICDAAEQLSDTRTGALMVLERMNNLDEIIRTGTPLSADVIPEMLGTIFYEGTPLHDGAVVIRDGRIVAAGCVLPLSNNLEMGKDMGTRHSARDTFAVLHTMGLPLECKPFSVGFRAGHLQTEIEKSLYHGAAGNPALPRGEYQLSQHVGQRCVYTFCMCPGGQVCAAASEDGGVVTNGMSYHARDGRNANAAVVVSVDGRDFDHDPVKAVAIQRQLEQAAYRAGGGGYLAPAETVGSFLAGRGKLELGAVQPTYPRGVTPCDLGSLLPGELAADLRDGITAFGRKLRAYQAPDAVLTGLETRTSSPVRLLRGDNFQCTGLTGLYPCGEGAGYAGGIMTAAVDGVRCAAALMQQYAPDKA